MSVDTNASLDVHLLFATLDKLKTISLRDKEVRRVFLKAGDYIRRGAIATLRQYVKSTGYSRASIRYGRIETGVTCGYRRQYDTVNVSIYASRAFRLRFFNAGTVKRYTRQRRNRGRLQATRFFKKSLYISANPARKSLLKGLEEVVSKRLK